MKMKSDIYLHDIPLEEAWSVFIQALKEVHLWSPLESEIIPLENALGRVTAQPIWAKTSSPHYHAAAMDGYALRAADTDGASDRSPIDLEIGPKAEYLDTGDPLPSWADAVIPIENIDLVDRDSTESIRLMVPLAPWTNVRPMGEDIVATELVLASGQELRPVDLGAIAGSGYDHVRVWRKPRVAILPTGSELKPAGVHTEPGQITEYNSLMLAAQVEAWGGVPTRLLIIPDVFDRIREAVINAAKHHDLILINAGSSAGSEDYTARVVSSLGKLLVHGVAVRPGHPVILGMLLAANMRIELDESHRSDSSGPPIKSSVPVIGVPGYPVSAALTGEIFVEPLIARWLGRERLEPPAITATMSRKVHSSPGDDEYLRVTVGRVGERLIAAPLSRGAGVISSLVRADGIVVIPAGVQGIQSGQKVAVNLYRTPAEIERTLLALGSHDMTIDLLAQHLADRGTRLSSANLGSVGGLIALERGEAHLAGSHLLNPDTGEYNVSYIKEYMPSTPVVVVALVYREQGLIVTRGNPKAIQTLADLTRDQVTFVNRQRGAGTRLLLEYHLDSLGLSTDSIHGYGREEYSHLTVAAAVASGRADCGLGVRAAADALNLDFIPLYEERFDLVIPVDFYQHPKLAPLLEVLDDTSFQRQVNDLPGYDSSPMGRVIAELS